MTPGSEQWARIHYGAPCRGPHKTIKIFGRNMTVHKKAVRGFRRIDRVFRKNVPAYYKTICQNPDSGAYNCRVIAGTSVYSNHAWPIAVDLRWSANARDGNYRSEMRNRGMAAVSKLKDEGLVRWGGDFSSPDDMHLEIVLTPEQLRQRYYWTGHRKFRK
jgi:hypothetical protein